MKYIITTVGVETEQMSLLIASMYSSLIPVTVLFYFVCDIGEWMMLWSIKGNGLSTW